MANCPLIGSTVSWRTCLDFRNERAIFLGAVSQRPNGAFFAVKSSEESRYGRRKAPSHRPLATAAHARHLSVIHAVPTRRIDRFVARGGTLAVMDDDARAARVVLGALYIAPCGAILEIANAGRQGVSVYFASCAATCLPILGTYFGTGYWIRSHIDAFRESRFYSRIVGIRQAGPLASTRARWARLDARALLAGGRLGSHDGSTRVAAPSAMLRVIRCIRLAPVLRVVVAVDPSMAARACRIRLAHTPAAIWPANLVARFGIVEIDAEKSAARGQHESHRSQNQRSHEQHDRQRGATVARNNTPATVVWSGRGPMPQHRKVST